MKIVDRKTFLALPPGTLYSKFEPIIFGELSIKGETCGNDFTAQGIADAIECRSSTEFADLLFEAKDKGRSLPMNFDCDGRDGCFDADQLFAVWEKADVTGLIERLHLALRTSTGEKPKPACPVCDGTGDADWEGGT